MSTFKGIVDEFPDIRIDYFRHNPGRRPPLACFLSHVHSDHLAGLESLKSPFIYCSAATKALLLNLESSSHKVNFELGILEARKQHFRHLKKLLKPIPLQTPTNIELGPGNEIRVTLFDANHCTGAVMFLIEGNDKAILYTGDIRSEPWFVNSLVRNPFLVPYAAGIKKLDCMYLDTSNIRPVSFPTKAEGLKELLQKVIRYPKDTVFHLTSWTFGYEEVWMALSQVLNSKIHVDKYKMRLYQSLRKEGSSLGLPQDAPVLAGYTCGNNFQPGCLTDNCNVRIHSCEKELNCSALKNKSIVWIRPIVTRSPEGEEVEEIGIGGGLGDLTKRSRLEQIDLRTIKRLLSSKDTDKSSIEDLNKLGWYSRHSPKIPVSLASLGLDSGEEICLHDFVTRFVSQSAKEKAGSTIGGIALEEIASSAYMGLPKVITFPYSRHASYEELCHLVRELNPRDIYPCTVNEANWHEGISMRTLFGHVCSAVVFRHDDSMRNLHGQEHANHDNTQTTGNTGKGIPSKALQSPLSVEQDTMMSSLSSSSPEVHKGFPGLEAPEKRRREILDDLGEDSAKRMRFNPEGPNSSPPPEMSPRSNLDLNDPMSQTMHDAQPYDEENPAVWDADDQVWRCRRCGYEDFNPWLCERCYHSNRNKKGTSDTRHTLSFIQEMFSDENDEVSYKNVGERYLDDESSAYDSYDERGHSEDKYEIGSFIVEDGVVEEGEEEGEVGQADRVRDEVKDEVEDLGPQLHSLQLGPGNNLREESMDDSDCYITHQRTVTDVGSAGGQLQQSLVAGDDDPTARLGEGYQAALGHDGWTWHDIGLVSTTNDHTHEEAEL